MHELTYLIIKQCEARNITSEKLITEIFVTDEEDEEIYLKNVAQRLFHLLEIDHDRDRQKIAVLLEILFEHKERSKDLFEDKIARMFESVLIYKDEEIEYYKKKLAKIIKPHEEKIRKVVSMYDGENTGFLRFEGFRKVMDSKEFKIKDAYLDFMIFYMKRFSEKGKRLDELKYVDLYDLFALEVADEEDESESEGNEEDEIVISNEEYNKKVTVVLMKLADILKERNSTVYKFFGEHLKIDESIDNGKVDYIMLTDFINILASIGIEMDEVETYCVYNKLKFVENYDAVNIGTLSVLLESFGVFEYTTSISQNMGEIDVIKKIPDDRVLFKLLNYFDEQNKDVDGFFESGGRQIDLVPLDEFVKMLRELKLTKSEALSNRIVNLIVEREENRPFVSKIKLKTALLNEEREDYKPSQNNDLERSKSLMDVNLVEEVYDKWDKNKIKKDRLQSGKGRRENSAQIREEKKKDFDEDKLKIDSFDDLNGWIVNRIRF